MSLAFGGQQHPSLWIGPAQLLRETILNVKPPPSIPLTIFKLSTNQISAHPSLTWTSEGGWIFQRFLTQRWRKATHQFCAMLGFSRNEDSIKSGVLAPGGFGQSNSNAMYFSLVSPLNPNPDPKNKPHLLHLTSHHNAMIVIDLESEKFA